MDLGLKANKNMQNLESVSREHHDEFAYETMLCAASQLYNLATSKSRDCCSR
jgi:hypothetical protein